MPSAYQVQFHGQQVQQLADEQARREAEARAQAAGLQSAEQQRQAQYTRERDALAAQYQSQQMNQQAGINQNQALTQEGVQFRLANQGASLQAQRDQTQFGYQQQHQQQGAVNQWNENIQKTDLQGQLNQTMLTQSEQMEAKRVKESIAAVNRNPDLTPEERNMLATQLQTKLNPLENRQRQASIIHSQLQSQGLAQQTQQQATLFNQQQEWRAGGIQNALRTVNIGGQDYHMYLNANGEPTILDTTARQETHYMSMLHQAAGVAATMGGENRANTIQPYNIANLQSITRNTNLRSNFLEQSTPDELAILNTRLLQAREDLTHSRSLHPVLVDEHIAHIDSLRNSIADNLATRDPRVNLLNAQGSNVNANTVHTNRTTADLTATLQHRLAEMASRTAANNASAASHMVTDRLNGLRADELANELALNTTPIDERTSIAWDPQSRSAAARATDEWISRQDPETQAEITPEMRQGYINSHLEGNGTGTVIVRSANGRFTPLRQHTPPEITPAQRATIVSRATASVNNQYRDWQTRIAAWNRSTVPVANRGPAPQPPAWLGNVPVNAQGQPLDSHGMPLDSHRIGLLQADAITQEVNRRAAQPRGQGWEDSEDAGSTPAPSTPTPTPAPAPGGANGATLTPAQRAALDAGLPAVPSTTGSYWTRQETAQVTPDRLNTLQENARRLYNATSVFHRLGEMRGESGTGRSERADWIGQMHDLLARVPAGEQMTPQQRSQYVQLLRRPALTASDRTHLQLVE